MKITFLGTAAAEGIPSPFCFCITCSHARLHRGNNVRKRSSLLINDDLMIDIGPDLVWSCSSLGISLADLKYVLVTHSHFDHFYPHNLEVRSAPYLGHKLPPILTIVAGPSVFTLLDQISYHDLQLAIRRIPILPYNTIELPPYTVQSFAANHDHNRGDAMIYVVDDGEKRIMYATDTGEFSQKTLEYMQGPCIDLAIIEATNGTGPTRPSHLNFEGLRAMITTLRERHILTLHSRVYATHFSHRNNPPHDELQELLHDMDIGCAFDGLVMDV